MAPKVESKAKPRRRRNPELAVRHAAAVREGIPASRFNLTPQERALLPDLDWVTEDDADYIIGMRGEREGKPIPLAKVLKRYGYRVED
jgi:hypothetical protein